MRSGKYLIFWLLSVLSCFTLSSQSIKETYLQQRGKAADYRGIWVDSLLSAAEAQDSLDQAIYIAHKEAIYNRKRSLDLAVYYSLKELKWYEQLRRFNSDYDQVLYNTGRFYGMDKKWLRSRSYFRKITAKKSDSLIKARAFCELGEIAFALNDPYAAVDHYQVGLELLSLLKKNKLWISKALNLALIFEEINTPASLDNKYTLLTQIDTLLKKTNISTRNRIILNNHYASYYNNPQRFDFERSKAYYLKNIRLTEETDSEELLAITYANLANLFAQQKNDSTLYFIQRAKQLSSTSSLATRLLNIESDFHMAGGNNQQALIAAQRSLERNLGFSFPIDTVPDMADLSTAEDQKLLLWTLTKKAELYTAQYKINKDRKYLNHALENVKVADLVADMLSIGNSQQESRLFWRRYASAIYGNGVFLATELALPDLAFYFAEKKQAMVLSQHMIFNQQLEGLPVSVASELKDLDQVINQLELQALTKLPYDQNQLYEAKQRKTLILDSVTTKGVSLKQARKWYETQSLEKARSQLKSGSAVLHFLWGGGDADREKAQVLFVSSSEAILFPLEKKERLSSLMANFMDQVAQPFTTASDAQKFYAVSNELYQQLFPLALQEKLTNYKDLVIIAANELGYLPFEALVVDIKAPTYLFSKYTIGYTPSMGLYKQVNSDKDLSKSLNFLGIAPVSFEEHELSLLPYTKEELLEANEVLGGEVFLDSMAMRSTFFKRASQSRILHLATHATADEQPWIALKDSLVYLRDLYALNLNNDLVVLSACNTASGQIQKGEGVASLASGFFYSGSRSVVSTRWNTNDKATQLILKDFYKYLSDGKDKTTALQLARLNYLKSAQLSEASPYYWSSFAFMGDPSAIEFSGFQNNWWWLLALVPVVLLFLFKKSRPKVGNR